jgi:hypothetical protein
MNTTPKGVRFQATRDSYGPTNRQVVIHLDESAVGVEGAGIDTSSSYLEFTCSVSTTEAFSPGALAFKESGAPLLIRDLRVKSRQNAATIIDEVANYNLIWDLLFRSTYTDAQRETLGRCIGAAPEGQPRTVFTPLPLSAANAHSSTTFTARIPLACLGGIFHSSIVPLSLTKGLTLEINLEDRVAACLSASTAYPDRFSSVTRFTGGAADKTAGATATLPVGAGATQATVQAAFTNVGVTNARVVTYTATGGPRLYDVGFTSVSGASPPVITFGADVGATDDLSGAIIEPRFAVGMVVLDALDNSGAASATVTSLSDITIGNNTIDVGDNVNVVLDVVNNTGGVTRTSFPRKVTGVAPSGNKIAYTLDPALPGGAATNNYNGGGYILTGDAPPSGSPGNSSYSLTNVGVVVTPVAITKMPKEMSWVSATSWVRPVSAGTSTLTWPTLPYGRAMAAIARCWTEDSNAAYGTGNGITDYEYMVNGESTVHGGPISFAQHSPQWRTELLAALEASDSKMRRSTEINDALSVALTPRGVMALNSTMSVIQLRISNATTAGNLALFLYHMRTLDASGGGSPVVTLD